MCENNEIHGSSGGTTGRLYRQNSLDMLGVQLRLYELRKNMTSSCSLLLEKYGVMFSRTVHMALCILFDNETITSAGLSLESEFVVSKARRASFIKIGSLL